MYGAAGWRHTPGLDNRLQVAPIKLPARETVVPVRKSAGRKARDDERAKQHKMRSEHG